MSLIETCILRTPADVRNGWKADVCFHCGSSDNEARDVTGLSHVPNAEVTEHSQFARVSWTVPTHRAYDWIATSVERTKLQTLMTPQATAERNFPRLRDTCCSVSMAVGNVLIAGERPVAKWTTSVITVNKQ